MVECWERARNAPRSHRKRSLCEPLISAGDLVFDIGASRGMLTLVFRWLGARVIAVEPLFAIGPEYVREFAWKFGSDDMVTTVPKAVAPKPSLLMKVHKNLPFLSSGSIPWMRESAHARFYNSRSTRSATVATTTLDALIGEYGLPQFIKIDVEGAESNVIRTLSQPVPAMSMEFHEDWKPVSGMEHMMGLADYEWNYANGFRGDYIWRKWQTIPAMLTYMDKHLLKRGPLSWGDIYCRRKDIEWN